MGHLDDDWLFSFRVMWTPRLVRVIYILGIVASTVVCYSAVRHGGLRDRLLGLLVLVVVNVVWRIACEGVIVIFSIHRELTMMNDELRQIRREAAVATEREHM
jgi:hypothetical protein